MRTSSIRRALATLAACLTAAVSPSFQTPAFAQACPVVKYSGGGYYGPSASGTSGTVSGAVPATGIATQWGIAWNHADGTVQAGSSGSGCGSGGTGTASIRSTDDFVLVGPPSGPVTITVTAAAHVELGVGYYEAPGPYGPIRTCTTGLEARLWLVTPADSVQLRLTQTPCPASALNQLLSLPVVVTPGAPFRVSLDASTNSGCAASAGASATLSFAGVPAGWSIQSCGGFVGSVAVPVHASSWGRLKSVYR